jgi:hypothetical protein
MTPGSGQTSLPAHLHWHTYLEGTLHPIKNMELQLISVLDFGID